MTLRARLTLFFVLIVVIPLVGAGFVVRTLVATEIDRRSDARLSSAASAVAALRAERLGRAADAVRRAGTELKLPADPAALKALREKTGLDFLVVTAPDGKPIASDIRPSSFFILIPTPEQIAAATPPAGIERVTAKLTGGMSLHGGLLADGAFARALSSASGSGVLIWADGRIIASSGPGPTQVRSPLTEPFAAGKTRAQFLAADDSPERVGVFIVYEASLAGVERLFALIILGGLLIASVLGWLLARLIARPLDRVASTAHAIARGELGQRVQIAGHDEVAQLGSAFNHMAENLHASIEDLRASRDELRSSRDELRGTLERLGAALGSTGAIEDMLPPILHAAAATLGARNGTLYRLGPSGVVVAATLGDVGDASVSRAAAEVVSSGKPVLIEEDSVTAVPLRRQDELIGVLALGSDSKSFSRHELKTLATFAGQASVAIDNVLLREEAERASLTDPLTGVRNRRYLEQLLTSEMDRATRYKRPLSIVMLDIDHFKAINDQFGHACGDRVLSETCARIASQIRTGVDTLARFGGEEFVIVLPETTPDGAAAVAAKVLEAVACSPFDQHAGLPLPVTISAGVASFPADAPDLTGLMYAADSALYRAKEGGRARFAVATPVGV